MDPVQVSIIATNYQIGAFHVTLYPFFQTRLARVDEVVAVSARVVIGKLRRLAIGSTAEAVEFWCGIEGLSLLGCWCHRWFVSGCCVVVEVGSVCCSGGLKRLKITVAAGARTRRQQQRRCRARECEKRSMNPLCCSVRQHVNKVRSCHVAGRPATAQPPFILRLHKKRHLSGIMYRVKYCTLLKGWFSLTHVYAVACSWLPSWSR